MIPGKTTAAFLVVCCAALLDSGCSFAPSLAHRRGVVRGGGGSASRGAVAAWATKRRPTLGPCLETLGLRRGATLRDAKAAFRREVRTVHPDRNPTPEAAVRYAQLTEAYAVANKELRGRNNNPSSSSSSDVFDFAQAVAGFAQAFVREVAVPMTRDVAAPVAQYMCQAVVVETVAPFWRRAVATATINVAQGRTWAGAHAAADQASRAAHAAKTRLAAAQEALRAFDAEVWVQPKLEAAHAAVASTAIAALRATALAQRASAGLAVALRIETAAQVLLRASSMAAALHSAAALGRTFGQANSPSRALDGALGRCRAATAHRQQAEATVAAAHLLRTAAAQQRDAAHAREMKYGAERAAQLPRRDHLAAAVAATQRAFDALGGRNAARAEFLTSA